MGHIAYDLALDSVEFEGATLPIIGGMRVSYSPSRGYTSGRLPCSSTGSPANSTFPLAPTTLLLPASLACYVALIEQRPPVLRATLAKNNDSLVIHLRFRNHSFFLPGDAELQAESAMLSENPATALQADVLKVGHHAGKNSTTPELLAAVRPQLAIISRGADDPYGHPNEELLQRLQNANVRILRTGRDGAVPILTDGERLEVSCFLDCSQFLASPISADTQPPDQKQKSQ